jgi:N-acetyl-1-D-myo-inositol-2-amino-2-deoxy-alpha-D-glucopyranoside deacetylase
MNQNITQKTLLAVLAHPDDETFGMGGTLALYAKRGVQVHLICATRGESGDVDPRYLDKYASVADRRVAELKCASVILGLTSVQFLDYRDSGMQGSLDNQHPKALAAAPVDEVAAKVAHLIRSLCPQVVVTFDPVGGYGHPDHIAIHNATVRAFDLAGDPGWEDELPPHKPQKLYFHVIPRGLLRFAVRVMPIFGRDPRRFGRNQDIDLVELVGDEDFPVHAKINCREVRRRKEEATACHTSQLDEGMSRRSLVYWILRWYDRYEYFMRAFPEPNPDKCEKDLFKGLT